MAIIAISFLIVGTLWGIGNLISSEETRENIKTQGIVVFAENNAFNKTNPNIITKANQTMKLTVINNDFVKHDFIAKDLNINTAYLSTGQKFVTAIASHNKGEFEYYCSFHPDKMQGKIIIE